MKHYYVAYQYLNDDGIMGLGHCNLDLARDMPTYDDILEISKGIRERYGVSFVLVTNLIEVSE